MISIMKSSSKVNEIQEEGRNGEANELLPMLQEKRKKRRDLNLGYPTWLSLPSRTVKTIVRFPRGDQVVVLQAFIGLGKT